MYCRQMTSQISAFEPIVYGRFNQERRERIGNRNSDVGGGFAPQILSIAVVKD